MVFGKLLVLMIVTNSLETVAVKNLGKSEKKRLAKRQSDTPYLTNCMKDTKSATEQYFLIRNGFTMNVVQPQPKLTYRFTYSGRRWLKVEDVGKTSGVIYSLNLFLSANRKEIRCPPFTAIPGIFRVVLKASVADSSSFSTCYFVVKILPPIVVLDEGIYRIVPPHALITLEAKNSMNLDSRLNSDNINSMHFVWKCTQKLSSSFCREGESLPQRSALHIPKELVVPSEVFNVTLTVSTTQGGRRSVTQVIDVVSHAALVRISCEKNCPPVTEAANYQKKTFFRASCLLNCDNVDEEHYEWEIRPKDGEKADKFKDFDYQKDTISGRIGTKFIIKRNVLESDTEYLVTLRLTEAAGKAGKTIVAVKYAVVPVVDKCEIKPPTGVSLLTLFKLHCDEAPPPDKNNFYQLFTDENLSEMVVSGFYPSVFEQEFFLPPSSKHKFTVQVAKGAGPAITLPVHPKVRSPTEGKTLNETLKIYQDFVNGTGGGFANLLSSRDPEDKKKGIEMFQVLVNEIIAGHEVKDEMTEFARKITYTVVEEFTKSPPKDTEQLVAISESIARIIEDKQLTKDDPYLASLATSMCRLMIIENTNAIKKQKFPLNLETQFNTIGKTLTRCLEANVHENFDLIRPAERRIAIDNRTVEPLELGIVEDYADYVDFGEDYEKILENLNRLTFNILNSTATAAKSLAYVSAIGENFWRSSGKNSITLVAKDVGKDLSLTQISMKGLTLVPSRDFDDSDHSFDVLISTWSKDLMWWNHNKTRVATNVASVQFWHSNCKKLIRNFQTPVKILIDVKKEKGFDENMIRSNVSLPENYSTLVGDDLNKYMRIHRVSVSSNSVLHIQFYNISDFVRFDVLVTKFQFPDGQSFLVNETVSSDVSSYIRVINYQRYPIWAYLAVLPSKTRPSKNPSHVLFYDVSFLLSFCIRWHRDLRAWKPECRPGLASTLKVVHCECKHFSAIGGYMQNARMMIQDLEPVVDIYLELQSCYVIFLTTAITFGLFCLLIIFYALKQQTPMYFLADNVKDHLYAYLVIVRTGNRYRAGTTSNVTIKMFGSNTTSDPHVLNYPDPALRLLQRQSEDTFVLTTQKHLGSLTRIELWYDCTGPNPNWECRDIIVYDMQQRLKWYFNMHVYFSVNNKISHVTAEPTKLMNEQDEINRVRCCNYMHTWLLWAGESNFSYLARLTVVFSNILMTYVLMIAHQGVPYLELKDAMDPYEYYQVSSLPFADAFLCASCSFLTHIFIAWIFRFSETEFSVFGKTCEQKYSLSWICWTVLTVMISTWIGILIVYGFWVPFTSSMVWLTCCLIAILFQVVVLENIFILLQMSLCKFKWTRHVKFDLYLKMINNQRHIFYKKFDRELLRPVLTHLYKPMGALQAKRRRIVGQLRLGIYNDLVDLLLYGIYNIILYVMILSSKGALTVTCKNHVTNMIEGEHTRTVRFSKLQAFWQVYSYVNDTLIPTMQPILWYGNFSILDNGIMIDNANKFIGVAKLRQRRSPSHICSIPDEMKFLNMTCTPEFSMSYVSGADFGPRWSEYVEAPFYDRLSRIWHYDADKEADTLGVVGRIGAYYSGGGYVAYLGRTLKNSYSNALRFVEDLWIDSKTRALFIDFLIYNANYNVFVGVHLLIEMSAVGWISSFEEITVVRMLIVHNKHELAAVAYFIIFILWIMMLNLKLIYDIVKHFSDFYKRVWLMIDILINAMSLICIAMYVLRMKMVEKYLAAVETVNHNEFVSYFIMLYVEEFLTYFAGILVCVATARLWKFLRFGLFFRITERTMSMAAFPLAVASFEFFIILTAFGLSGLLIYGNEFPELSDFIKIVATLVQLALKPDQFNLSNYLHITMSVWYFSLYLMCMQIVLFVYIIVIIMAYMKAQLELSVAPDSYTVVDYIKESSIYFPITLKSKIYRLRGGAKHKQSPVAPKADEFRYANSVGFQISRIESMKFITSCVMRNMRQTVEERRRLTEHETIQMLGVCKTFVLHHVENDDFDLFFKGHFEGDNKMRFIDEKRINKIADFVNLMFEDSTEVEIQLDPNAVKCVQMVKKKSRCLENCFLRLKLASFRLDDVEDLVNQVLEDATNT